MLRKSTLFCILGFMVIPIAFLACSDSDPDRLVSDQLLSPAGGEIRDGVRGTPLSQGRSTTADLMLGMLDEINVALDAANSPYRVGMVEWIMASGRREVGNEVFFNDRGNRQLGFDFVPNDPRRVGTGAGDEITYLVDQSDGGTVSGLSNVQTEAAIDAAMATWGSLGCLTTIVKAPDTGADPDLIDGIFGFPGGAIGTPYAQITHAGWITSPGIPIGVLGFTFTFGFTDAVGFTDIDNNGKLDAAFREIYYHDVHAWTINGNIDVETVALHEAGHGLSQAHFGKLFRTDANGVFHFAPRAVMNAGYTGVQQVLTGTDEAGHCSLWDSWPNN